jgi:hypothetical protein
MERTRSVVAADAGRIEGPSPLVAHRHGHRDSTRWPLPTRAGDEQGGPLDVKKTPVNGRSKTAVTFEVPAELKAQRAFVVGEFNDWSTSATEMKQRKDGRCTTTVRLANGRPYRFRYLLDGERWENDWAADRYVPNEFGTEDSVVEL